LLSQFGNAQVEVDLLVLWLDSHSIHSCSAAYTLECRAAAADIMHVRAHHGDDVWMDASVSKVCCYIPDACAAAAAAPPTCPATSLPRWPATPPPTPPPRRSDFRRPPCPCYAFPWLHMAGPLPHTLPHHAHGADPHSLNCLLSLLFTCSTSHAAGRCPRHPPPPSSRSSLTPLDNARGLAITSCGISLCLEGQVPMCQLLLVHISTTVQLSQDTGASAPTHSSGCTDTSRQYDEDEQPTSSVLGAQSLLKAL
jgi:hypothetical protein